RNGGRRDNRRETPAGEATALPVGTAAQSEAGEATDTQRRERRGRNDNRRRGGPAEGAETLPQGTVEDSNLAPTRDAGTAAVDANENAVTQAPEGREDDGAPRAPRERRSRDRYGRDRRERAPRDETEAGQASPASAEPVTPSASAQDGD